jgi:hypothetical protein
LGEGFELGRRHLGKEDEKKEVGSPAQGRLWE